MFCSFIDMPIYDDHDMNNKGKLTGKLITCLIKHIELIHDLVFL